MTSTDSSQEFFDELIGDFYVEVGDSFRSKYSRGQLLWTHIHYADEDLKYWRPKDFDDTRTTATDFRIVAAPSDLFNRATPLYYPPLEINEEFCVVRTKRRPVVLIAPCIRIECKEMRRGRKINNNSCIAAPLFSVVDKEGKAKYPLEFIDRVRKLEFPNIFFFPEMKARGIRHSVCRLDLIQRCNYAHLDPLNLSLSPLVYEVFQGSVQFYLTEKYGGDYQVYRESILT